MQRLPLASDFKGQTPELLSPAAVAALELVMQRAVQVAIRVGTYRRTCINCKWFNEAAEQCHFYQPVGRPPARIIANGCDAWDEKDPF